ncbi:TadE-like protein [Tsuneonella dongtanensis]|uniref:TadE-like protein n=1 Tax=Tsuneonella dongtanensis TaxID=692370 RepID=A0A1B2AF73_9SPHN|nr:TadE family protein [Tsuneonella dongtanensis]ANY20685.1 TadE-like protein [Tsuneonella dongtanensis]
MALLKMLARCSRGTAVIETAFVAPILAVMAVGIFEMGTMVQKQQELQSAASEAEAIILAAAAGTGVTSTKLKSMLSTSTGIPLDKITLDARYRCGNNTNLRTDNACPTGQRAYEFVQATFRATYTPTWTEFGFGNSFNYVVVRTIQVG